MPFCAASAMITSTSRSAMPTAPTRRLITTRNRNHRKRNIAVPRTTSSSGGTVKPKSWSHSTRIEGKAVPGAPAVGRRGGCASTPARTPEHLQQLCQWKKRQCADAAGRQSPRPALQQLVERAEKKNSRPSGMHFADRRGRHPCKTYNGEHKCPI